MRRECRGISGDDPIEQGLLGSVILVTTSIPAAAAWGIILVLAILFVYKGWPFLSSQVKIPGWMYRL